MRRSHEFRVLPPRVIYPKGTAVKIGESSSHMSTALGDSYIGKVGILDEDVHDKSILANVLFPGENSGEPIRLCVTRIAPVDNGWVD